MQTCATCCYFVLRDLTVPKEGEKMFADCRRFPPQIIISTYKVAEIDASDKPPLLIGPSGVPAHPLSLWYIEPQYSGAFTGVAEDNYCGEWKEIAQETPIE